MSAGAIAAIVIAGLFLAGFVPIRIAVAKQRRVVAQLRARFAAAGKVHRRADGIRVDLVQRIASQVARSSRTCTCALTDDGLYGFSEDGAWGGCIRFGSEAREPGDRVLAAPPALFKGGVGVAPGDIAPWIVPTLASLPLDGLLLQLKDGIAWFVGVPDEEAWFAALMLAIRGPG